jgi:hypothetical protein
MLPRISLLPPKNERQQSVNDFWHCIIDNPEWFAATLTYNRIIAHSSSQSMVLTTSGRCPKHERQRSVNNFGLALWKMQALRGDTNLSSNYRPPFYAKMVATPSLVCPRNDCQWSVNDFWPCILGNGRVVRQHWPLIELLAPVLGKNANNKIVTMSRNEHQWSDKDFCSCIFDNLAAMEHR